MSLQTLFDSPHPLRLTAAGRWVLAMWATCEAILFALVLAAWLR